MSDKIKSLKWVLLLAVLCWGVSCSMHLVELDTGTSLMQQGKFDEAVAFYNDMMEKYPKKSEIRSLLFRAKINSYYYHLNLARRYRKMGKKAEAEEEYKAVLRIFPGNSRVLEEYQLYSKGEKKKVKEYKTTIEPPVKLKLSGDERIKELKIPNSPIMNIFKALGKSFNINFVFDKDFRDFVYSIDIKDAGFYDVLNQLCMVANVKYRIMDSSSVLIYPDTTFKKRNFDLRGIKVFYLSNIQAEDAKKIIMSVFRDQQLMVQEDVNLNCLIVKGSSDELMDVERFLHRVDKQKGEVEIDIEILEVNRTLINSLGLDYGINSTVPNPVSIIGGEEDSEGNITSTVGMGNLDNTSFYLTIPTVALNFLESDDRNKIIAKPNLRGVSGEEIKFMLGDEIPIPQTQLQAIAAGGINNSPVTTYQYKNVGTIIKVTPYIHHNHEVTLQVKMTINFISSFLEDNFPVFGKRELENIIRLKEGETNLIGGFIKDEMRNSLQGLPALSKIPILGKLFGNTSKNITQTDLIFTITPRILRNLDIDEADQKTIWTNVQSGGGSQQGEQQQADSQPVGERPLRQPSGNNSISISPARKKVAANTTAYFAITLKTKTDISTLSLSGSLTGGELLDLNTDFLSDKIKVLKNVSKTDFDVGYSFFTSSRQNAVVGQLKMKFPEKGVYKIQFNTVNAYTKDRKQLQLQSAYAEVEVF